MDLSQDMKIAAADDDTRAAPRFVALEDVLAYRHDGAIERFIAEQGASREVAELLFEDVKRWLWLCHENARERLLGVAGVPERMTVFATQTEMDTMWHAFILFTWDYAHFCATYFGRFIHHFPTTEDEKDLRAAGRSPEENRALHNIAYSSCASYAYDKLGPEVARRWYVRRPAPTPLVTVAGAENRP